MRDLAPPDCPKSLDPIPEKTEDVHGEAKLPFQERLTCSIAEACGATGLGKTKLYELIGQRAIASTTVGRRRLIQVESLRAFLLGGH
jgi:excisionase family DNA binding protein